MHAFMSNAPAIPHYTARGGARIGWVNATWPLAKLTVTPDQLMLSIFGFGEYLFSPADVVALDPVYGGQGVRVVHCRANCPERIIFFLPRKGDAGELARRLEESGFTPSGTRWEGKHPSSGMPLRWWVLLLAVAVWVAPLLPFWGTRLDSHSMYRHPALLGREIFSLVLSMGLLYPSTLQRIMLKPGCNIGGIRFLLMLLAIVSGVHLLVMIIAILPRVAGV